MKAALIKLAKMLLTSDKKVRSGTVILILSIIIGTLGLMFLPIVALQYSRGSIAQEVQKVGFDRELFALMMDTGKLARGEQIAVEMEKAGLQEQTLKAQLLYISCFENVDISDFAEYAAMFSETDNAVLIANLNEKYGLNIRYETFMRSYVWVLNQTVNPYMVSNPDTKNAADLAAWARNAYLSGWAFEDGKRGEMNPILKYRMVDNAGLIQGYLDYSPAEKVFRESNSAMSFTVRDRNHAELQWRCSF